MFEKIDEIFKNIEDIRDDINILLNIAKIAPFIFSLNIKYFFVDSS